MKEINKKLIKFDAGKGYAMTMIRIEPKIENGLHVWVINTYDFNSLKCEKIEFYDLDKAIPKYKEMRSKLNDGFNNEGFEIKEITDNKKGLESLDIFYDYSENDYDFIISRNG